MTRMPNRSARGRRNRVGWRHGPTDTQADAQELDHTQRVVEPYDHDTPSVAEVHQAEDVGPDRPIPVDIAGVVRTDELPCRTGGIYTRNAEMTPNRSLLNADPRRKLATICPIGGDVRFGSTQAEASSDGAGGVWPNGVPFLYSSSDELWCAGVLATVSVTVIVENWAR